MKTRSTALLLTLALAACTAFAKGEPKEYDEGKVLDVYHNQTSGLVNDGAHESGRKFTYVIEGKDGRYEAREFQTDRLFKPLDVSTGSTVLYRLHPKRRVIHVFMGKGERPLEVLKFTPNTTTQ
jgi:hypothetical protein